MKLQKLIAILLIFLLLLQLASCAQKPIPEPAPEEAPAKTETEAEPAAEEPAPEIPEEPEEPPMPEEPPEPETVPAYTTGETPVLAAPEADAAVFTILAPRTEMEVLEWGEEFSSILFAGATCYVASDMLREITENWNGYIVAIDAGHQAQGNYDTEPIGPGASEMKAKVSSGTTGISTGIPEYELTLQLSLKLQELLEARGYHVIMTRTTHDIDISNIERATIANDAKADAFIRVHANGSTDSSVSGALTICQTPNNPYNGAIYDACFALSTHMLDELVAATDCVRGYVWETDTMCGINWCEIPVTIVEVGYMSNPEEDQRLATDDYQNKVAEGMANGIDAFFLGESTAE